MGDDSCSLPKCELPLTCTGVNGQKVILQYSLGSRSSLSIIVLRCTVCVRCPAPTPQIIVLECYLLHGNDGFSIFVFSPVLIHASKCREMQLHCCPWALKFRIPSPFHWCFSRTEEALSYWTMNPSVVHAGWVFWLFSPSNLWKTIDSPGTDYSAQC